MLSSFSPRFAAPGTATAVLSALGVAATLGVAGPADAASPDGPPIDVIVRYDAGGQSAAREAVALAGGTVGESLDVIGGFAARLSDAALDRVRTAAGVTAVTADAPVRMTSAGGDDDSWDGEGAGAGAPTQLTTTYGITRAAGVHSVWARSDATGRKITGAGVGVALIDSGVAPVAGLDGPGKVVNGPDLSFESQAENLRHLDTFGHGTHLAGIIAGRDADVPTGAEADPTKFVGVAPGAHIVNIKVAAADGATDVSQVIAAIDWVVQHRNDPGMNIRVLNLSFGTDSVQDAALDPLSFAVEVAWRKGIVVVVAVGNDGAERTRVSMPAANPHIIAVGAADPAGTTGRGDDTVADFSTRGDAARHADFVAAGRSVVSLRAPGSYVDAHHPEARVGDPAGRFLRGSGTSQSAAVVSGAAALLVQQRPTATPDQVKRLLMGNAQSMPQGDHIGRGTGQLDVSAAAGASTPNHRQSHPAATGLGTLEGARGSAHVADSESGVELTGEQDIFGQTWTPSTWTQEAQAGTTWQGGTWNGTAWTGDGWTGSSWAARTWSARTWSARTWSARTWSARTWSGSGWS
ncbi:MAG TPA: S8 family serine peptidase [Pilimelia sp.]|nr:S8 family serine peptidase [Pilimelia sp.]